MGCESIATTISRMGKEPTTLGPEDLKGHRFSAFLAKISVGFFPVFGLCRSAITERNQEIKK